MQNRYGVYLQKKNNLQYPEFHGDSGGERYKTV